MPGKNGVRIEREPEKPLLPWKRKEYERIRLQWNNEKEEKWAVYLAAVKASGVDPRGGVDKVANG